MVRSPSLLTDLLKKAAFHQSDDADKVFTTLKTKMTRLPILALPGFAKTFIVGCNASGVGLGALLMQKGTPSPFTAKGYHIQH